MTRKKNSTWFILLTMVVSVALIALVGCESKSVLDDGEGDAPAGTIVSVTASPTAIELSDISIIEANVVSNSVGVADQVVTFTVSPANAGYFNPAVDTTNSNGIVASVFTSTTAGSATVSCSVTGSTAVGSTAMSISDAPIVGSGAVTMSPSRTLLMANGTDTSHITIFVQDAAGQPAADSTHVRLTAGEQFVDLDGNGYWSEGADSLVFDVNGNDTWDAIGIIVSSAFTSGGNGQVSVDYISGIEPTTVYIKVTVDDNGINGSVDLPIQLTPNATIASIYVASDSMSLVIKGTGGIETSRLFATGYDYLGNRVPEGIPLTFAILDNPSNPLYPGQDSAHLSNVLPHESDTVYTNSQGVAECPISSGHYSGTIRIQVTDGNVLSNVTQILVASGPPAQIDVGMGDEEDCNVPYWNSVNKRVGVVAVVRDYMHNPVNDSTVVYFTTDESTVKSHETRTMDGDGVATTEWISGQTSAPADGVVWVIAETAGGTVKDSAWIHSTSNTTTVTTNAPNSIIVNADGDSKFILTYYGFDINGNPVDDGTVYKMYSRFLDISGGAFEGYCDVAFTEVQMTSKVLKADYSTPGGTDDGIGAIDEVNLTSFGGSASYFVTLATGVASKQSSSINADPSTIRLSGYTDIDVSISDRWGNPLGDHTLNMTSATGTVTGGTQNTNMYGEAGGFRWTAPSDSASIGEHVVTVTDTDPRGNNVVMSVKITVE